MKQEKRTSLFFLFVPVLLVSWLSAFSYPQKKKREPRNNTEKEEPETENDCEPCQGVRTVNRNSFSYLDDLSSKTVQIAYARSPNTTKKETLKKICRPLSGSTKKCRIMLPSAVSSITIRTVFPVPFLISISQS